MKFRKKYRWKEKKRKKEVWWHHGEIPQLERYIKAISGVDVCRALVTIPTLLIMFCKEEEENEKATERRQRTKGGEMKGMGTATFLW